MYRMMLRVFFLGFGLALILTLGAIPSFAGTNAWTSEGPYGGAVRALGQDPVDPSILYAASEEAGMWKSLDGGESWFAISDGLVRLQRHVRAMAVHPSAPGVLLIHTNGPERLLHSTDGGASWAPFGQGLSSLGVLAIEYAPSDGDTVYIGAGGGVWLSRDGGASWQPTGSGLEAFFIEALAVHPTDPSTVYVYGTDDEEGKVFLSHDAGATWLPASEGLPTVLFGAGASIAIDSSQPDKLYAALGHFLFESTNGGDQWNQIGTEISTEVGDFVRHVAIDPRTPGRLFVGTSLGGIYLSTDGGATWTQGDLDHQQTEVSDFCFGPVGTRTVYFVDSLDGGVFRSDDGLSWRSSSRGLAAVRVESFTLDETTSTLYAAANNGVHRRPRDPGHGEGWELLPGSRREGQCCFEVLVDPQNSQRLYASGRSGVIRSTDGGENWTSLDVGASLPFKAEAFVMDPESPNTLYLGVSAGVWKTTNQGESWSFAPLPEQVQVLVIDPFDPDHLLAATTFSTYQSFDEGKTWTLLGNAPGSFPKAIVFDPLVPNGLYGATSSEVTRSGNGGATWFALGDEGLPPALLDTLVLDPRDQTTLYAGTSEGLYVSRDEGMSWSPFEGGIDPERWVTSLFIDPGPPASFYAGTYRNSAFDLTRGCIDSSEVLCLDRRAGDKRFAVSIDFDTALGGGFAGAARATSLDSLGIDDGGIFSFFTPDNPEALVKVIDACGFNDRFWVFSAATTSVGFDLVVEDTLAREQWTLSNPDDHPADSVADIDAFATCDAEDLAGAGASIPRAGTATREAPRPTTSPRTTLAQRAHDAAGCMADATTLCIDDQPGDRRFAIRLHFDSVLGEGVEGDAMATPLAPLGITDGGILSFFDTALPEVLVKVIDGCDFNGHYWLFSAATTNLGFELTVEDTHTGTSKTYTNPDGMIAETVTDVSALATCDD